MTARVQARGAGAIPDRELRDLCHRLGAIPRGRGRRFPAALRARIMAWTVERRAHGDEWCELSRALGIQPRLLKRWVTPPPQRTRRMALRPVAVIDEPPSRTVTVVTPSGLRIEDVTIADAIAILRGLA